MNSVARFLEARGRTADALEVATDPDYRFELAVQLSKLDVALEIAETADSEGKWRQLSELAMSSGKLQVLLVMSHCAVCVCRLCVCRVIWSCQLAVQSSKAGW